MDTPNQQQKTIPLTSNFGQSPTDVLGVVNLLPEGINPHADTVWELFRVRPELFTVELGYTNAVVSKDGIVQAAELLEISLITKDQKSPSNGASMALNDIIDDLV